MARHDDDDDAFDARGLLKDGRTLRVPLMMRDAVMARDAAARRGFDDSAARHQPGPIIADRTAAKTAYEAMRAELSDAWRTPANTADTTDGRRRHKITSYDPQGREIGSAEWEEEDAKASSATITYRGQQEGDQCTIDGAPGHLNAQLECVPDPAHITRVKYDAAPRTMTTDEARKIRKAAYDQMVADMCGAWRNPSP